MPTADRPTLVPLAIECFMRQTFTDSELLIVDDGAQPIHTIVPLHPRIRYIRLEGRKLCTGAKRNACCDRALGQVIAHWDDDDWSAPNRLQHQVDLLRSSGAQLVGYHSQHYYDMRRARCFSWTADELPYAAGNTQCYNRAWWALNQFEPVQVGEDSFFSEVSRRARALASVPGDEYVVARHHDCNTFTPGLGTPRFPSVPLSALPGQFFIDCGLGGPGRASIAT